MNTEELLKEAIRLRKPIEFEYNREKKVRGKRIGNPHILFVHPAQQIKRRFISFKQGECLIVI